MFKVPGHFAQRNRRQVRYRCALLQRVDIRSLSCSISTTASYSMSKVPLSKVFQLYTQAFFAEKNRKCIEDQVFLWGLQHSNEMRLFFPQVHSQKSWGLLDSFKSQLFAELRWTEDFKVKWLPRVFMLNQWTGNVFWSSHKLESSSSLFKTVWSNQGSARILLSISTTLS